VHLGRDVACDLASRSDRCDLDRIHHLRDRHRRARIA
jgi:hypothetical protein